MKPAYSVIFLTTLIGIGQGLFLALFTHQSYALFDLLPQQEARFYGWGSLLALLFTAAGLLASFFHLGRPERAWRSAAQWRTSWLSREVIVLPAFMGALFLYGAAHFTRLDPILVTLPSGLEISATILLGSIATMLAFVLFVCTGMIYACLRFLQEWHSPLTVVNFILLGGASGFTLAALYGALAGTMNGLLAGWALVLTLVGLAARSLALWRNARLRPKSTVQTAIGVKHPQIVQKAQGAMGGSFNTREFFHGKGTSFLNRVRTSFLLLAFAVPALLLAIDLSYPSAWWLAIAFASQFAGLVAERWYFFAEAKHPQNLYYQGVS